MAIILLDSFDGYGGNVTAASRLWSGMAFTSTAGRVKTGASALGGNGSGQNYGRAIAPGSSTVTWGMWIYWTSGTQPSQGGCCLGFTSSATYNGFNAVCSLSINTDGSLRVTNGFNSGTTIATSASGVLASGALTYVEVQFTFGASGAYTVKVNGSTVLSGSANMGGTTIGGINLGNEGLDQYAVDSLWMFDSTGSANTTFPPEKLVVLNCLAQAGNGAHTGLTPSTGTDHGANVDEAPPNDDTDYNAGGAGLLDTYLIDPSLLAGRTRYGGAIVVDARADTAGTNTVSPAFRAAGVDYLCPAQAVTTSYGYVVGRIDDTAGSAVGLTEVGAKVVAAAGNIRVSQVYGELLVSDAVVLSTAVMRRTLAPLGTRVAVRQPHFRR